MHHAMLANAMYIESSTSAGVAVIRMTNPAKKNAMSTAMLEELVAAIRSSANDDAADAVVIVGSGDVFSAGADISEQVDDDGAIHRMELFCHLYEAVTRHPKPTVAAISGPAVGGGAEMATGCDLRVGDPTARFRFPGAAFGIPIGSARLPLLIGLSHAKDLLMTTRMVDAEEALRMGLLNRLVPSEELENVALELASAMARNPGAITQKRLLDEVSGLSARLMQENRGLMRWQMSQDATPEP